MATKSKGILNTESGFRPDPDPSFFLPNQAPFEKNVTKGLKP